MVEKKNFNRNLGAIYQMWRFDREAQHACFDNRAIGFGGEVDSYGHGRNSVTPEQVNLHIILFILVTHTDHFL